MDLRNRTISRYEIEALFRDVLNQTQREQIGNLLKLLGLYVFLDREQLDAFAEGHFGKKIGLSFIQKAVRYNLVSEVQSEENLDKFFFELKMGGFSFLDAIEFRHRKLTLDSARKEREKILSINQFLINEGYLLTNQFDLGTFEPLFTTTNVVLYKDIEGIIETVEKRFPDAYPFFTFKKLTLTEVQFYSKAKGNAESMLV